LLDCSRRAMSRGRATSRGRASKGHFRSCASLFWASSTGDATAGDPEWHLVIARECTSFVHAAALTLAQAACCWRNALARSLLSATNAFFRTVEANARRKFTVQRIMTAAAHETGDQVFGRNSILANCSVFCCCHSDINRGTTTGHRNFCRSSSLFWATSTSDATAANPEGDLVVAWESTAIIEAAALCLALATRGWNFAFAGGTLLAADAYALHVEADAIRKFTIERIVDTAAGHAGNEILGCNALLRDFAVFCLGDYDRYPAILGRHRDVMWGL